MNLILRFALELAALTGIAMLAAYLATGPWSFLASALAFVLTAAVWGVFNVPGDPSRSGKAPIPVRGWLRLVIELTILVGGCLCFAFIGWPWLSASLFGLIMVHYIFSLPRLRWLLAR